MKIKRKDLNGEKWFIKVLNYIKRNVLIVSIVILLISAGIMILKYILQFSENGLSDNTSDWAHFGSYLGSITGLLAFVGVLYTASLSAKKAEEEKINTLKAEKESIIRKESDILFRMLELLKDNYSNIIAENPHNNDIYYELKALKFYTKLINKLLFSHLIKIFFSTVDNNVIKTLKKKSKEEGNTNRVFYIKLLEKLSLIVDSVNIYNEPKEMDSDFDFNELKKKISEPRGITILSEMSEQYIDFNYLKQLYSDFDLRIEKKELLQSIEETTSNLFNNYGTYLEPFCKSFKGIVEIVGKFNNKESLFCILETQLNRLQLVLFYYFSFSRFSDKSFIKLLIEYEIFYGLDFTDLLIFNVSEYEEKEVFYSSVIELLQNKIDTM